MTKQTLDFLKRADSFRVLVNGQNHTFTKWSEAAKFYNENVRTANEYQRALNDATPIYKNSFAEVVEYIGTRPYRQRAGYTAHIGNTDYVITRRN